MSVSLEHLLLSLNPAVLRLDRLRALIEQQQCEIAAHLGMAVSDLFRPIGPGMQAHQIQEIGQVQACWLATMLGESMPPGWLRWANAPPVIAAALPASPPTVPRENGEASPSDSAAPWVQPAGVCPSCDRRRATGAVQAKRHRAKKGGKADTHSATDGNKDQ